MKQLGWEGDWVSESRQQSFDAGRVVFVSAIQDLARVTQLVTTDTQTKEHLLFPDYTVEFSSRQPIYFCDYENDQNMQGARHSKDVPTVAVDRTEWTLRGRVHGRHLTG